MISLMGSWLAWDSSSVDIQLLVPRGTGPASAISRLNGHTEYDKAPEIRGLVVGEERESLGEEREFEERKAWERRCVREEREEDVWCLHLLLRGGFTFVWAKYSNRGRKVYKTT